MRSGLIKEIIIVHELIIFKMLMMIKIMMRLLHVFVNNNGNYLIILNLCKLISKSIQKVHRPTRANLSIAKFGLNINFT